VKKGNPTGTPFYFNKINATMIGLDIGNLVDIPGV